MLRVIKDASFGVTEQAAMAGVRLAASQVLTRKVSASPGRHALDDSYRSVTVILGEVIANIETVRVGERDLVILVKANTAQYKPAVLAIEAAYLWNRPGHARQVTMRIMRPESPRGPLRCIAGHGGDAAFTVQFVQYFF